MEPNSLAILDYPHPAPAASPAASSPAAYKDGRWDVREGRKTKRQENQAERTRIRQCLQAGLRDPEIILDLEGWKKNIRKWVAQKPVERHALLETQKRKVKAELGNTRDLDTFIRKTSRSRTLHASIALGFFRQVLESETYREGHRYKLAIKAAMEDADLAKSIQRKWDHFDRQFPEPRQAIAW